MRTNKCYAAQVALIPHVIEFSSKQERKNFLLDKPDFIPISCQRARKLYNSKTGEQLDYVPQALKNICLRIQADIKKEIDIFRKKGLGRLSVNVEVNFFYDDSVSRKRLTNGNRFSFQDVRTFIANRIDDLGTYQNEYFALSAIIFAYKNLSKAAKHENEGCALLPSDYYLFPTDILQSALYE